MLYLAPQDLGVFSHRDEKTKNSIFVWIIQETNCNHNCCALQRNEVVFTTAEE
jgi:hypothetical protein